MAETTLKMMIGTMLLLCGIQDALKKKIYLWMILLGAVFTLLLIPFCNSISSMDRIGGVIVGIAVILISIATGGKIGLGDGLVLCVTGLGLGFWGNLELFAIALFISAIISIILLVFRLANRKKSIPFIPFILVSYVFLMTLSYK